MTIKKLIFTDDVKNITNEQIDELFKNVELNFNDLKHITTNEGSRVSSKGESKIETIKINHDKVNEIADKINQELDGK